MPKKFAKDFKTFLSRGNVLDMAVGVIVGGAFGKIVSSLVADIVMPLFGLLLGKINISALRLALAHDAEGNITSALNYGQFLMYIADFIIISFFIFTVMRLINKLKSIGETPPPPPAPPPAPPEPKPSREEILLAEIRDLLKEQNHFEVNK